MISVIADLLMLSAAIWGAFALRFENVFWVPDQKQFWASVLTVFFTIAAFIKLGLYRAVIRYLSEHALLAIIAGIMLSSVALIVFGFITHTFVPRSVPVIYGAIAFLLVAGTRFSARFLINRPRHRHKEAVLIVGAGEKGMQLASALKQGVEYRPVGFLSMERSKHRSLIDGLPVFSFQHVEKAVRRLNPERLLLALDDADNADRRSLIQKLEQLSVTVQTVPSMTELVSGRARINDIRDLDIEDLLGRDPVSPNNSLLAKDLENKVVMVTGAGGSIGSELCRQIVRHRPKLLVVFEQSEFALYSIERELTSINMVNGFNVEIQAILGSVCHSRRCEKVMKAFGVQTVYHAAAYKHVPLVEHNIIEGIQNNVFGTLHTSEAAIAAGVENFVLISTDKAVRPTNVMGASKRVAELVLQGLAQRQQQTRFSMVRFGNVLGSSGSVVPLFRDQIRDGGPVTVTHPDIIRYFMTIPEASQLVLQAGSMGGGGEVFVLDMGEPVKIADLARKMIHLMGLTEKTPNCPHGDIEVTYSGLRPGEKLYEELLIGDNPQGTEHARIMMAREISMSWSEVELLLANLMQASQDFNCERIIQLLKEAPTGYSPNGVMEDLVWKNQQAIQQENRFSVDNVKSFPV
ncbi:nucleoside-diphosphate sugar epimerase/dehydratase [Marinobacter sp. SS21]|uniref:nucleoside-diphosphate sugar epimerase/dehydratase n=1 Tax=Marinobacter sp. SS21 TaxID=2979460 RepID=UPI00232DFA4B|nr:nucleoside-diphosphate sugar epimerase/dehydratase [Marinobacter sp. SS21]MDC0664179.1 nucleoside-diphosphate sugar epimerase/dehydratase [Marinobacter sp. SS21]